jgi:hypothetical protein
MRHRIFVGGSSEELPAAKAIRDNLVQSGHVVKLWNQGIFSIGKTAFESLLTALEKVDAAVFVFARFVPVTWVTLLPLRRRVTNFIWRITDDVLRDVYVREVSRRHLPRRSFTARDRELLMCRQSIRRLFNGSGCDGHCFSHSRTGHAARATGPRPLSSSLNSRSV